MVASDVVASNPLVSSNLLYFMQHHGYFILFCLIFIEGASVTYVAGFAASLGFFKLYLVYLVSFLGAVIGDMALFYIGRHGGSKLLKKLSKKAKRKEGVEKMKKYVHNHPGKMTLFVKLTPGMPVPGILMLGASELKPKKFFLFSVVISAMFSLVLTMLGFYSGEAFNTIAKYLGYGKYLIIFSVIFVVLLFLIIRFVSKKISKGMDKNITKK